MNCTEAQAMIDSFLKGKLSNEQEEGFIRHVQNCHNCHEELEFAHIFYSVVSDDDENIVDFSAALDRRLELSKNDLRRSRQMHHILGVAVMALILVGVAIMFM